MTRRFLTILVIAIGSLRMLGWLLENDALKGIGALTCASPLPIVFTEVNGVETFASDVYVVFENDKDSTQKLRITPSLYSGLAGPYNRRNVIGAAIAYGPVMREDLWQSVLGYGLCKGVLQHEMGLPPVMRNTRFLLETRTADRADSWILAPWPCD